MSEPSASPCVCCSFLCAVCRIACFTCIRRLCPCCVSPPPLQRAEVSILCLGLQAAGKTTLLATLAGEPADTAEPTVGFLIKVVNVEKRLALHFQELGGSEQIRTYWDRYYSGRDLIVYVIDSGCSDEELSVSQEVLTSCLRSPSLTRLPLLVVCSKQDLPAARSVNEMKEQLNLREVAGERAFSVVGCSSPHPQSTRDSITEAILELLGPQRTIGTEHKSELVK